MLLIVSPVRAQVKFYTLVSESAVPQRQTFQVQYVVEGASNIRQFTLPRFKDFEIAEVFDHSSSVSYGKGASQDTYSKIVVLLAVKKGKFTIPGATAVIDGKTMRSNSKQVTVQAGNPPGISHIDPDDIDTEEESVLHPGENIDDKIQKNFFLRVEPSKTTCYVGEALMVVYKAYSRLNANSQVVKRPSLTGFSVMEMVDVYDGKPEIEKLNGRLYYTNLIRKVQLFPLQEGTFTLDEAEIESVIHFVRSGEPANRKSVLKKMFDRSSSPPVPVNHRTLLRTEPVNITVKPLPTENQPPNFKGAVGQFAVAVKVPTTPVRKGDLVKIQVAITGSGNLSLLTPPDIHWPPGVDTAEPQVKEHVNKYAFPLSGSKIFEYAFAAPDTGEYIIPAVKLPYFDPVNNSYKTATSDSIVLHILPGVHRKEVVKNTASRSFSVSSIPRQFYWFALVALAIIGAIVFQVLLLGRNKKGAPKDDAPADVKPVDKLQAARLALEQHDQHVFFNEVQQALWNEVAQTYQVLPSQLNKHHIEELLAQKHVPAAVIKNFISVLDECEWALYTPHHSASSMADLLGRAAEVIKALS